MLLLVDIQKLEVVLISRVVTWIEEDHCFPPFRSAASGCAPGSSRHNLAPEETPKLPRCALVLDGGRDGGHGWSLVEAQFAPAKILEGGTGGDQRSPGLVFRCVAVPSSLVLSWMC